MLLQCRPLDWEVSTRLRHAVEDRFDQPRFQLTTFCLPSRGGKTIFVQAATGGDYVKDALEDLFICPLLHLGDRPAQLDCILVNGICGADMGMAKINEVMTQVSKRFGSREDIVFGAVIDESRSQSLELCILGKAEMDSLLRLSPLRFLRDQRASRQASGLKPKFRR